MPDLVWIEPKWSLCSHKSPSHSLQQSEEDRQNHKFWNLMWNNSILCKTVLTSEEKCMFMFLLIVRLWLWKQVFKLFQLTRTSHHPVLHYHHVSRCKSYMLRQYCLALSLKFWTFPGHSNPSICHPSITAQPYQSCDRPSGPWCVLTYLHPLQYFCTAVYAKSPLTLSCAS